MMLKEKSSPWARLKYLYVLPVAAIAMTAFARPEVSDKVEEISRMSDVLAAEPVGSLLSHIQDVSADKVNDLAANAETKVAETAEKVLGGCQESGYSGTVGVRGEDKDNSKLRTADVTIYVDNVKVDMKDKKLDEVVPDDRIESIKVRKDKDGKGELYITTKSVGKPVKE